MTKNSVDLVCHRLFYQFDANCCDMDTAIISIKHPVPDWVKPSFCHF